MIKKKARGQLAKSLKSFGQRILEIGTFSRSKVKTWSKRSYTVGQKFVISTGVFALYVTVFACVYTFFLSEDLWFETIEREPSYKIAKANVVEIIFRNIVVGKASINLNNFEDYKLQINRSGRSSEGEITIRGVTDGQIQFDFVANIPYRNGDDFLLIPSGTIPNCVIEVPAYRPEILIGECTEPADEFGAIDINEDVHQIEFNFERPSEIEYLLGFMKPHLSLDEGLFARMVYFSSVTATTLGYGDIVPVTSWSRFAVALESILGLILIGALVFWTTR